MNSSNTKRKCKRKTRSERNQLLKPQGQIPVKNQQKGGVKKESKYINKKKARKNKSDKAAKGVSNIPKVKSHTSKSITEDRLIVKRPLISLAKSKSSDWINRRALLPESEDMKKKIDQDMKEMLENADKLNQGEPAKQTESEPQVVESYVPDTNEQGNCTSNNVCEKTNDNGMETSAVIAATSHSTPLSCKSTTGDSGFSTTPQVSTLEGNVDDKALIKSVADNMIREPRLCCFKIFNKKQYGHDIKTEIMDLWKERKSKLIYQGQDINPDLCTLSNQCRRFEDYDAQSTLSSCRAIPLNIINDKRSDLHASQDKKDLSIFGNPTDTDVDCSIFLPATSSECGMLPDQCLDPDFRIYVNPEEMDTDQEDEDESWAKRCEYFVAASRRLEAEQKALQELKQQQLYRNSQRKREEWKYSSSDVFHEGLPMTDSQKFDWDSLLQPDVSNCFYYGKKDLARKPIERRKSAYREINQLSRPHRQQKLPFEKDKYCKNLMSFGKDFEVDTETEDAYGLSMSRHKLHTALQRACRKPSLEDSEQNIFSILNPDVTNAEMDEIFGEETSNDPWCLTDLRSHQVDLQQQAHEFLSNHGAPAKFGPLIQTSSPDSNGSPVWLASSVLKDMVL